ncbi:acyl-CoA N-acyltransferase [Whalleya microplaca]|nr:acyl-CoA N-acyltransferase [Whalleya microplaca]
MQTIQQKVKRKRATTNPIEQANLKNDETFINEHLRPTTPTWTEWTNPKTQEKFSLSLTRAGNLTKDDLNSCFRLVEETSRADYEPSSIGWRPAKKFAEMKSPELRYIIVKDAAGSVRGFTSLMPTYEEGEPVVYCYEIHLKPELQGTGLGKILMGFHERVAVHTPPIKKVMLTCFLSNQKALGFYKKSGFEKDALSPEPRKLRFGKEFVPDYVIMSKVPSQSLPQETSPSHPDSHSTYYIYTIGSVISALAARAVPGQANLPTALQVQQIQDNLGLNGGKWKHNLCDCSPCMSCVLATFIPCFLIGQTSSRLIDPSSLAPDMLNVDCLIHGVLHSLTGYGWVWVMLKRSEIRLRFGIEGGEIDDYCTAYWCRCCALIQQDNEVKLRMPDPAGLITQQPQIAQAMSMAPTIPPLPV